MAKDLSPKLSLLDKGELDRAHNVRPVWQPDEDAPYCGKCESVFGFFLRKHHCRACGLIFCYQCTENQLELPPDYGYSGPQRVCYNCFAKFVREQELLRSTKDELLTIQFYLRDSEVYRVRSREIYNLGHRLSPDKTPSLVEFKDPKSGTKSDHILSVLDTKNAPVPLSGPNKKVWENLLYSLEHPFIFPVLEADFMAERERAVVFRPFCDKGSLRDIIYGVSDPKNPYFKKYTPKVKFSKFDELLGMPNSIVKQECISPLSLEAIRTCGRQILAGLLFLQRSKVPYPHLHTANVIFQQKRCCLTDIENVTCGFRPYYVLTLRHTAPEVECFGNVLYEMAMGFPRYPNILSDKTNLILPENCNADVTEILRGIFEAPPENPMTVERLLEFKFFSGVQLKGIAEIPQKAKGMTKGRAAYLQTCKEHVDSLIKTVFELETERAKVLLTEKAKKMEDQRLEEERNASIAAMVAKGTLGDDDHVSMKSRRPGEHARAVVTTGKSLSRTESELNDEERRKRRAKKKEGGRPMSPEGNSSSSSAASFSSPPPTTPTKVVSTPSVTPASPSPAPPPPPPAPSPLANAPPPPPAPPGPAPPPPPPGGAPKANVPPPSAGRNALLDAIRNPQNKNKLKTAKTVDKSGPLIKKK